MSADESRHLYFLVEGDPRGIINEALLSYLKTSDVILRRLHDPIEIKPAATLTDRLPSSISDASVVLDEPTDAMPDVFPRNLAKGHLHIIVLSAVERLAKKSRLEREFAAPLPMSRSPSEEKRWSLFGAVNRLVNYQVDPATQAENNICLDRIREEEFCRASGKTIRLFRNAAG